MNEQAYPFMRIDAFTDTRNAPSPLDRLKRIRHAASAFREAFLDEPCVEFMCSRRLVRVPYPGWYAFTGVYAQRLLKPAMVSLMARVVVLQFLDFEGKLRTLLFSPSDHESGRATPFFERFDKLAPRCMSTVLAPVYATVPQALADCGIRPEQVDYITFDHLHTQDLRRWLGDGEDQGYLPNARLVVHQDEWRSVQGLLPTQADWYCPNGVSGVPEHRVITFEASIQLGRGLSLIHTPGHTEGNHSLVYRAPDGIRVSSENGVAADSWTPLSSRHNAIRRYAQDTGAEVIINGNTQERSVDQYLSMVLEKTLAGPARDESFSNCVPSAECTPYWLFPGTPNSHVFGDSQFGQLNGSRNIVRLPLS